MEVPQIFSFENNQVRTILINDEPYFVGKDVANVLGYSNTKDALLRHVDSEDKMGSRITTSGQSREMTIINESGLYSLILKQNFQMQESSNDGLQAKFYQQSEKQVVI